MPDRESLVTDPRTPAPSRQAEPAPRYRGRARATHLWRGAAGEVATRWDLLAVIAAGGALGSLARAGLETALPHPAPAFPWATFIVNVTGCALLGALMVCVNEVWRPSRYLRPFLGVGVLGGYTTFSAYMLDTRGLLVSGHAAMAGAYLMGSLAAGLFAVWAGAAAVSSAIRVARWRARRKADDEPTPARPARNPPPPRSQR